MVGWEGAGFSDTTFVIPAKAGTSGAAGEIVDGGRAPLSLVCAAARLAEDDESGAANDFTTPP
ncbi:hypothetical protein GCM10009101_22610 [Brevundimonas lenta]